MGRTVDIDLVVDAVRIADRLGVTTQAVHNWKKRELGFPEPIAVFGKSVLWYWPDVEKWLFDTDRVPAQ